MRILIVPALQNFVAGWKELKYQKFLVKWPNQTLHRLTKITHAHTGATYTVRAQYRLTVAVIH